MRRAAYAAPAILLVVAALLSSGVVAEAYLSDFHFFWLGARIVAHGGDPYDPAIWSSAVRASFAEFDAELRPPWPSLFRYPLWTAVTLLPLAALPLPVATAVWQLLLVTGAVAGATLALRAAGAPTRVLPLFLTIVLASQPFVFTVLVGQFGGVMLLAVAAYAVAVTSARQIAAGLALAALAVKPHIAAALIPLSLADLVARRQWRAVVAAAAAAAVLVGASLALRPTWPIAWVTDLTITAATPPYGANVAGVLTIAGVDRGWALVAIAVAVLVAAALLAASPRMPIDVVAVGACLSLIVTPYSGSHDHLLLAPVWARTLAIALRSPSRSAAVLLGGLVLVASLLPWALYALALLARPDEALNGVVPVAAFALLGLAYAIARRNMP